MIFAFGPKRLPIFVCDVRRCASLRRNLPARTLDAPSPSLPENGPEVYQAAAARGDDAARAARSRALPRRASPSCRASHLVLSPAVLSRLLLLGPERQMWPSSTTPACSSLTGDSHLRLSDVSEVRSCENDDLVFP